MNEHYTEPNNDDTAKVTPGEINAGCAWPDNDCSSAAGGCYNYRYGGVKCPPGYSSEYTPQRAEITQRVRAGVSLLTLARTPNACPFSAATMGPEEPPLPGDQESGRQLVEPDANVRAVV